MTQGGEFEKEEPSATAVAPQACLELIGVWVCCVLLVGGQAVLKEGRMGERCLEGLPWAPDRALSPWPRQC